MSPALIQLDSLSLGVIVVLGAVFAASLALLYFVFRMLKRSVKMAFRMALVAAIFIIIVAGAFAIWWFGTGTSQTPKPRPPASRPS